MSTRTNYCPNPTCSVNGSDYFGGGGSARATGLTGFTNRTTGYRFVGAATAVHPKSATLTAGVAYTISSEIKPEYTGTIKIQVDWYRNGSWLYSDTAGATTAVTNGTVVRLSQTSTAPWISGTLQALLVYVDKAGTIVSAEVLYEQGTLALDYFDGDSAGGAWTGTSGLSVSTVTVADAANVFPTSATLTVVANDSGVTRTSSSPSAELASASLTANNATVRIIGEGPPLDLPPAAPEPVWTIYARNSSLGRSAQVDDFATLDAICRFNDVGTWELQLDYRATAATELAQPGAGIEIRRDDFVIMTGPVTRLKRDRSDGTNLLTVSGVDDNVWLKRRLAHPQPASTAPPYNSQADDNRTGTGSTVIWQYVNVNLGPGAIATRRLSSLTMGTDPAVGSSISGRARYDVLLDLIQDLAVAAGDLAFRIVQDGAGLVFEVYEPEDKSDSIVFSEGFGNLSSFAYEQQAPEFTYVYGGGDGEGTAREIVEGQDSTGVAEWGRIERLVDARQQEDAPEVSQQIETALSENSSKLSLEITPVDTPNLKYGEHYQLGDRVSVVVDGVLISDSVRQVEIRLTQDGPQQLTPVLGTPGRVELLRLFAAVRDLASRTRNLERR